MEKEQTVTEGNDFSTRLDQKIENSKNSPIRILKFLQNKKKEELLNIPPKLMDKMIDIFCDKGAELQAFSLKQKETIDSPQLYLLEVMPKEIIEKIDISKWTKIIDNVTEKNISLLPSLLEKMPKEIIEKIDISKWTKIIDNVTEKNISLLPSLLEKMPKTVIIQLGADKLFATISAMIDKCKKKIAIHIR